MLVFPILKTEKMYVKMLMAVIYVLIYKLNEYLLSLELYMILYSFS